MVRWIVTAVASLVIWTAAAEAGALPDPGLTPGTFNPSLSVAAICSTKWGKHAHHVTAAMKRQVFAEYGLTGNTDPYCQPKGCEIGRDRASKLRFQLAMLRCASRCSTY